MIPKRIYYIWIGNHPLPDKVKANIASWQEKNPDYQIIKISEDNYDIDKYQFVKDAYQQRKWAFASDVIRLDVLCQNGGFYFDTDVKMLQSLEPLRKNKSVWGMETSGEVNSGLIVGAKHGDDDLQNILAIYKHKRFVPDKTKWFDLITTNLVSDYFIGRGMKIKNKKQTLSNGTVIYPTKYFAPLHWWGGGRVTGKAITVHQYEDSWGTNEGKISGYRKFKYNVKLHCPTLFAAIVNTHKKMLNKKG
jgi:hypothetical protein